MSENKNGTISIKIDIDGNDITTTTEVDGVSVGDFILTVETAVIRTICNSKGISGYDAAMLIGKNLGSIAAMYDIKEGDVKK